MTATYTHSRPETKRKQLTDALITRPGKRSAEEWVKLQYSEYLIIKRKEM
jgi:hypothetical protein